jgi:DNA-directed RNA polymerase subunit E'
LYAIYEVKDTFRLPPEQFNKNIEEVAAGILQKKYEGTIDKQLGVVVAVFNIRNISDGAIYAGDPATHHNVGFDLLAFMPYPEEVVAGEVTELVEFGAFIRIGPMEGLVHVSQVTNEFLSFDKKTPAFVSKKSGRSLKRGDVVFAKISTVSMKNTVKDSKIALTMRPEGLGKEEWQRENERMRSKTQGGGQTRRRSEKKEKKA